MSRPPSSMKSHRYTEAWTALGVLFVLALLIVPLPGGKGIRLHSKRDCAAESWMLNVGDPAPEFDLPDAEMEMVSLASFRGRHIVVLYF